MLQHTEYTKKKSIAYNFTSTVHFNILLYEILLFMKHIIFKYIHMNNVPNYHSAIEISVVSFEITVS